MGVTPLAPQASASASSATFAWGTGVYLKDPGVGKSLCCAASIRHGGRKAAPEAPEWSVTRRCPAAEPTSRRPDQQAPQDLDHLAHLEGLADPGAHVGIAELGSTVG